MRNFLLGFVGGLVLVSFVAIKDALDELWEEVTNYDTRLSRLENPHQHTFSDVIDDRPHAD